MSMREQIARWLAPQRFVDDTSVRAATQAQIARAVHVAVGAMQAQKRGFESADVDEITFGFTADNTSIDVDLQQRLERLRGRSRRLAKNNDHAKRYLQMVGCNIVGPEGFTLQARATEPDGKTDGLANTLLEASFAQWGERGVCEVSGGYSFVDLCTTLAETVARDGEALARIIRGKEPGNRWNFALQLIDIDRLPIGMNELRRDGNAIIMGVEVNRLGRPVAYHIAKRHPQSNYSSMQLSEFERVEASEIVHVFRPIRPEQRRGVPWMHTCMTRLEMLGKFETAALVAARKGAETIGFFTTKPDADEDPLQADAEDATGTPIATSVPGSYDTLPPGVDFKPHESQYPTDVYGPFTQWLLRSIASGLGVAYTSLANDLTGVSYSSIRTGALEERDQWMQLQRWFASAFLRPVYLAWCETAITAGAIAYASGAKLPTAKIDKFQAHRWDGRRWAWVDPQRDINSAIESIKAGLKSRRMVCAEQGRDFEDVVRELAEEKAALDVAGIAVSTTVEPAKSSV